MNVEQRGDENPPQNTVNNIQVKSGNVIFADRNSRVEPTGKSKSGSDLARWAAIGTLLSGLAAIAAVVVQIRNGPVAEKTNTHPKEIVPTNKSPVIPTETKPLAPTSTNVADLNSHSVPTTQYIYVSEQEIPKTVPRAAVPLEEPAPRHEGQVKKVTQFIVRSPINNGVLYEDRKGTISSTTVYEQGAIVSVGNDKDSNLVEIIGRNGEPSRWLRRAQFDTYLEKQP